MALTITTVGAAAVAGGLFNAQGAVTMALHFGSGNYTPALRAGTIQAGQDVMAALAGSPELAGARSDSGPNVQWAFTDSMLSRAYDYAEVVFVATQGGVSTPVYLDSAPANGGTLGSKAANTLRQWVLQVNVATGALVAYETRITVPQATEDSPGIYRLGTEDEAEAANPPADAVGTLARTLQQIQAWWARTGSDAISGVSTSVTSLSGMVTSVSNSLTALVNRVTAVENGKAPLASPALTGSPTATTAADTDNSTRIATTAHVKNTIAARRLVITADPTEAQINALPDGGEILVRSTTAYTP